MVAPYSFESVEGMIRKIGAPSPQTLDSKRYVFVAWSDGKAQSHEITTQKDDKTYTATYGLE